MFPEDLETGQVQMGENGEHILVQDFPIPVDAMAVRMQVGDLPVTIVGWITDGSALPGLLRNVADEAERIVNDRAETAEKAGD